MSDTNILIVDTPTETPLEVKPEDGAHCVEKETEGNDNKSQEIITNTKSDNTVTDDFEKLKIENENLQTKITHLECDLQLKTEEKENFKNKVHILENLVTDLKSRLPNTLSPQQQNAVEKMKKQSEEILTRAKGIIFDKSKLIKHQELQIETLTLQIASLKEVLAITKELLEIRNLEVKELNEKMEFMESKIAGEKLRQELMNAKMDAITKMNTDLKAEYETQLKLFNELRTAYTERERLDNEQQKPEN